MITIGSSVGYRTANRTRHGSTGDDYLITGDDLTSFGPGYVRGHMMSIFSVFLHNKYH